MAENHKVVAIFQKSLHFSFHQSAKKGVTNHCNSLIFTVGAKGFEPSTPCSQSRCASRTAPYPEKKDDSASSSFFRGEGGIRTPGIPCGIRQFSKLLVSATHPPLQRVNCGCKNSVFFITRKRFLLLFFKQCDNLLIISQIICRFHGRLVSFKK